VSQIQNLKGKSQEEINKDLSNIIDLLDENLDGRGLLGKDFSK